MNINMADQAAAAAGGDNGNLEPRVDAGDAVEPPEKEEGQLLQALADEATAKKRGRPRRKSFDDVVSSFQYSSEVLFPMPTAFSFAAASEAAAPSGKRPRGRPKGSGKYQTLASQGGYMDTAGGSFIPHVLLVTAGEDLVHKIASFCVKGPRSVCVLAATGAVSKVTLQQPGSSIGTLTYEGWFEILTLTGSSVVYGELGTRQKKSMLSVSLANAHGQVFGGSVVGPLIAAGPGPIQLIVASFKQTLGGEIRRRYSAGCSTSSPNIVDSSEMVNVPIQVAGMEDGCVNSTPPPFSPPPPVTVRADDPFKSDKVVADTLNFNSASPESNVGPNSLHKPENESSENQHIASTSMQSVDPNNLGTFPVSQPISDEMITPDTNASDHELHV